MRVRLRWQSGHEYIADVETTRGALVARVHAIDGRVFAGAVFLPDGTARSIDSWPALGDAIRDAVTRREDWRRQRYDVGRENRARRQAVRAYRPRVCDVRMPSEATA